MLVVDADAAPATIDRTELLSGADWAFGLWDDLPEAGAKWAPRKVGALIDAAAELPDVLVHRLADAAVLIEAVGEPPLVIATGAVPETGRWAREAVVIVAGNQVSATALSVVNELAPRLVAVAGGENAIEETIEALRDLLDGTGLMAMERALALEV
ncbi:MAG: hypothetical protein EOP19_02520 [Hyphomicrobiales bacterium]|nr:MAG: hypothetical protein EOP19_02520 [Hyphomicrobiales bacterium]